jgi:hypothetical protein
LDSSAWIPTTTVSAWVHGGLVGLEMAVRAILLAQDLTDHDLTVSVAYDYSDTYTDVRTWTAAQLGALATSREILQVSFTQPECTAYRIKVTCATPSSGSVGTGQGTVLIGMQSDLADQGIIVPLPDENRQ